MGIMDTIKGIPKRRNFYPTLAICCSITALVMTSLAAFGCWFVTTDLTQRIDNGDNPLLPPELQDTAIAKFSSYSMGPWGRETSNLQASYCVLWSSNEKSYWFDAYWKAARAFGMITAIFGLLAMVVTILHACTRETITNRNMLPCYGFVAIMQALFFLGYGSDLCKELDCQYSSGSTYAIVAIVLYLLTGIFHFMIYKQESSGGEVKQDAEPEQAQQDEEAKEPEGGDVDEPSAAAEETKAAEEVWS